MTRFLVLVLLLLFWLSSLSCSSDDHAVKRTPSPAAAAAAKAGFDRMVALQGDWVGDGPPDVPGEMTVNYKLTGGGSTLVETLFAGKPQEMVTVYTVEDGQLMLTHYCMLGNQPRMRAEPLDDNVLAFHFVGGANIDPQQDPHMHDAVFEFVSDDELVTQWTGWSGGAADPQHGPKLHFKRKS
jgi:hypothetical protein